MQIKPLDNEELAKDLAKAAVGKNVDEVNFLIRKGANASEALAEIFFFSQPMSSMSFMPSMQPMPPMSSMSFMPSMQPMPPMSSMQPMQLQPIVTPGAWQEDAINLLISKGADKNIALALLASKSNISALGILVNKGADKSVALAMALERGDLPGAKFLISKGADKEKALASVALKADIAAVDLLISKGASKDIALGNLALVKVVSKSDMAAIDLLISKGASKEKALARVASKSDMAAVDLLISKGTDKSVALASVASKADIAAVDLLISKGTDKSMALVRVVLKNDVKAVDLLISKGADIQAAIAVIEKVSSPTLTSALKIAAVNLLKNKAHEKAGAALLELSMENSGDLAAEESKEESAPSSGSDQGPDGGSSNAGYVGTKRSRLEAGEDQEESAISYSSAQSSSSSSNPNKVAKTGSIINAGSKGSYKEGALATVASKSYLGEALACAASKGDMVAVNLLISKGADKDIALASAALKADMAAVDLLISKGANKSMALATVAPVADMAAVDLLISKGAIKEEALARLALKSKIAAITAVDLLISKGIDLLISKGADIKRTIAGIEKASSPALTSALKIAAVNLLKNKAHEKAGAALLELSMENSGDLAAEESKEESAPSSGSDQGPDGGSSNAGYVGTKRSRLETGENREEEAVSYFSAQSSSSSSNPNKSAKTVSSVSAGSKRANLNSELNSSEGQKELIPSGVFAHSLLKDISPVLNSLASEGDNAEALTHEAPKAKAIRSSIDLANAASKADVGAIDSLISKGADKEKALARVASKADEEAVDLLITKGADKNIAYIRLALKGEVEALDLLRSKGASNGEALASIEKIPNKILSQKDKIAAKILLTNAHKEIESASDSEDDLVSVSENENDQGPDDDSSDVAYVETKSSRLESEKDEGDIVISYSSAQSSSSSSNSAISAGSKRTSLNDDSSDVVYVGTKRSASAIDEDDDDVVIISINQSSSSSSNPNKASKTDSTVSAGSKRASLNEESNSSKDQHSDVQLEIKTKLEDQIIYKSLEERDLEEAEKEAELVASNENQNIVSLAKNIREDLFDHQYLPEKAAEKQVKIYETLEISQLYQWGKWVYGLIENAVNSPLVFTDKSGGLGAYSLSYDDGLPKIDMDSASAFYMNEAL